MQPIEKIEALRRRMSAYKLDAWIVPSSDPHQSEYVAAHWQARAWLSGFSGSAGTLVVTLTQAGLWTDPRYHLRAAAELAGSEIQLFKQGLPGTPSLIDWLCLGLPAGATVGFDGGVLSVAEVDALKSRLDEKKMHIASQHDLVAEIWAKRPALPLNPLVLHPEVFAGESRQSKLERMRSHMRQLGAQFHLLCALDDIAWTLNLRGSDIDCNPVAVCYAVIALEDVHVFIQPEKVSAQVVDELAQAHARWHDYAAIQYFLQQMPPGSSILIDPDRTNLKLRASISVESAVLEAPSLPYQMKTLKNQAELAGIRRMHRRDGVAMVRFLYWLETHLGEGQTTEISAAEKLADLRSQGEFYIGQSFHTIAGYAAHSAVGHYQTDPRQDPILRPSGIFLIDSGAQYLDGTSDMTRSISLGQPSALEKLAFTSVLKAHIRLASARFVLGTRASQLDAIAREPLWRQGWNCRHGIGHGVGCFLNVHEGPIRFNEMNATVLEAGMVISNEPGVYFEGNFGIRIENILITVSNGSTPFGDFLAFETVSLCPIDLALVDRDLLDGQEIAWLNAYHRQVRQGLSALLDEDERAWLLCATRQI